jgi:hypothetical protein
MAENAANDLGYFLRIRQEHIEDLASLRHWPNLKMGTESGFCWIRDIDFVQLNSVEVKSIPFKDLFYSKNGKLFMINSLLPYCNVPSLLWTPIERAMHLSLPSFNHNLFEVPENISIRIGQSDEAGKLAEAMICELELFEQFIVSCPEVRLKNLKWTLLETDKVFILGRPLLPLNGDAYWKKDNHLFPAGYALQLPLLTGMLDDLINTGGENFIIWNKDNSYSLLQKSDLQELSIGSFRRTMKNFLPLPL